MNFKAANFCHMGIYSCYTNVNIDGIISTTNITGVCEPNRPLFRATVLHITEFFRSDLNFLSC